MTDNQQTKNYALNIWFSLLSEDEGKETGYWLIDIYELMTLSLNGIEQEIENERKRLSDKTIYLQPSEVEALSLGSDEDFWLDLEDFFDTYTNIPLRVSELLLSLPEYEMGLAYG
jgi:hypothetical protein